MQSGARSGAFIGERSIKRPSASASFVSRMSNSGPRAEGADASLRRRDASSGAFLPPRARPASDHGNINRGAPFRAFLGTARDRRNFPEQSGPVRSAIYIWARRENGATRGRPPGRRAPFRSPIERRCGLDRGNGTERGWPFARDAPLPDSPRGRGKKPSRREAASLVIT